MHDATRGGMAATTRIELRGNGDDHGRCTTTVADVKTATRKTIRDRVRGIAKTTGIEDGDRTQHLFRHRDPQLLVWISTHGDASTETGHAPHELLPEVRGENTPQTPINHPEPPSNAPSRQHATPTPSKPSSAPFHHLPSPLYVPAAAAPIKLMRWVSSRASPPHTTQQWTFAETLMLKKIGAMRWKHFAIALAGSNKAPTVSRQLVSLTSK
jgi:hypothetical protein